MIDVDSEPSPGASAPEQQGGGQAGGGCTAAPVVPAVAVRKSGRKGAGKKGEQVTCYSGTREAEAPDVSARVAREQALTSAAARREEDAALESSKRAHNTARGRAASAADAHLQV